MYLDKSEDHNVTLEIKSTFVEKMEGTIFLIILFGIVFLLVYSLGQSAQLIVIGLLLIALVYHLSYGVYDKVIIDVNKSRLIVDDQTFEVDDDDMIVVTYEGRLYYALTPKYNIDIAEYGGFEVTAELLDEHTNSAERVRRFGQRYYLLDVTDLPEVINEYSRDETTVLGINPTELMRTSKLLGSFRLYKINIKLVKSNGTVFVLAGDVNDFAYPWIVRTNKYKEQATPIGQMAEEIAEILGLKLIDKTGEEEIVRNPHETDLFVGNLYQEKYQTAPSIDIDKISTKREDSQTIIKIDNDVRRAATFFAIILVIITFSIGTSLLGFSISIISSLNTNNPILSSIIVGFLLFIAVIMYSFAYKISMDYLTNTKLVIDHKETKIFRTLLLLDIPFKSIETRSIEYFVLYREPIPPRMYPRLQIVTDQDRIDIPNKTRDYEYVNQLKSYLEYIMTTLV